MCAFFLFFLTYSVLYFVFIIAISLLFSPSFWSLFCHCHIFSSVYFAFPSFRTHNNNKINNGRMKRKKAWRQGGRNCEREWVAAAREKEKRKRNVKDYFYRSFIICCILLVYTTLTYKTEWWRNYYLLLLHILFNVYFCSFRGSAFSFKMKCHERQKGEMEAKKANRYSFAYTDTDTQRTR